MRHTAAVLLALFLATSSAFAQTIVLVRHAEKTGPEGDVPLSDAGHARAAALAAMLKDSKVSAIFVTDTKRTQQTAAPLAKMLSLTPDISPASDTKLLAQKLNKLAAGSIALVVNHSNGSTRLAEQLGTGPVTPMPETEFDRVMILTKMADGKYQLLTLRYGAATQ